MVAQVRPISVFAEKVPITKRSQNLVESILYNERSFFPAFMRDMANAKKEVIVYSPFISGYRMRIFSEAFTKLKRLGVNVYIFTRPPEDHEAHVQARVRQIISAYQESGAVVLYKPGNIHEKVAIIDRHILYEGSLNILSQRDSQEMMRKFVNAHAAQEVMDHLGVLNRIAKWNYFVGKGAGTFPVRESKGLKGLRAAPLLKIGLGALVMWWIFLGIVSMIPLKSPEAWAQVHQAFLSH